MAVQGTRLETDEDVRRALLSRRPAARGEAPAGASAAAPADDGPPLFRPGLRPPTPLLTVYDDGSEDGEVIRIRKDRFVIGRAEGDLLIPNDSQISSRHAELRQSLVKEKYRWNLIDLKSTNGTYVRINSALLEHGQEFILGRTRYRFENQAAADGAPPNSANASDQGTRPWQSSPRIDFVPAIVEQKMSGNGSRVLLSKPETWFGKDATNCQVVLAADPFVSARHACIRRDSDGRWQLESNKSVNGVWLRIEQIPFKGTCRFMLGEQQFMIRTPA